MIETGPDEKIYPVAKLATIVEALAAEGVKPQDALRQVRLDAGAISSPQTRVSLNQIIACCRNALSLSRDPFFAYHAGLRFHASTQGMYGFAILSSTDHRRTMDLAIKYHRLATPLADIAFREEGGRAIWIINPAPYPEIDAALYRFLVDMQLGIHLSLHRDVMGRHLRRRKFISGTSRRPTSNATATRSDVRSGSGNGRTGCCSTRPGCATWLISATI